MMLGTGPTAGAKLLIYGASGVGKTALLATLATAGYKLHILDLERGHTTLMNTKILPEEFRGNVDVAVIPDLRTAAIAYDTVSNVLKGRGKICNKHGKVSCAICVKEPPEAFTNIDITKFTDKDVLVVDTLTQLSYSALNRVCKDDYAKPNGAEYKHTFNDYGAQGQLIMDLFSYIQALNINIICISHETGWRADEEAPENMIPIAGTRNMSRTVGRYFDDVIYMTRINGTIRAFNDKAPDRAAVKNRSGFILDNLKGAEISLAPVVAAIQRIGS